MNFDDLHDDGTELLGMDEKYTFFWHYLALKNGNVSKNIWTRKLSAVKYMEVDPCYKRTQPIMHIKIV